jgi:glycosyltransferase involved in cell wall biosynthesis
MKILYYSAHPHLQLNAPTGYGTHMREMINAWRKIGIEVKTLIAGDLSRGAFEGVPQKRHQNYKEFIPKLVWETFKDFQLMRFDASLEKKLSQVIDDFQPDLIYERVTYLQNSGVKTANRKAIRHISEVNAPYPLERVELSGKSLLVSFGRNVERQILAASNKIVVVSTALADHFEAILPGVKSKVLVVPNNVNQDKVVLQPDKIQELRKEFGLADQLVVGFVGSIFPYHGVDILIQSFAKLPGRTGVKLLIVGDGLTLPDLKEQARKLGVFSDVIFTGSVPHAEVYNYIQLMDICCLMRSNWYMSPVKIFEYGVMKKAVVAADVSAVRDVMTSAEAMIVSDDAVAFQAALQKLIHDPILRDELGGKWHEKVIKNHTWDIAAQKILDLCE